MADFILSQSASFLAFFCCGICAGALFDLFRLLRRLLPHIRFTIAVEDVLFWLFNGILLFFLLFFFQSGKLRFFLLPAFLAGCGFWSISIGRLLMGPVCRFLLFLKKRLKTFFTKFSLEKSRHIDYTE